MAVAFITKAHFPPPWQADELRAKDLSNAVFFHRLGTSQSSDRKLFDKPEHPDWQFEPHLTFNGHWLIIRAGEGEVGDKVTWCIFMRSTLKLTMQRPFSRLKAILTPTTFIPGAAIMV